MDTISAIKNRRSIRKYQKFEIPEEDLKNILTCGMMAPSACNTRPWEFIIVDNEILKKKIVEIHKYSKMILEASKVIVVVARDDLQKGICNAYWPQDCAAVTENILLASVELGYGSCWCGVYPNEERVEKIKSLLNIKKGIPFNIIAIGKANENPICKGKFEESKITYLR